MCKCSQKDANFVGFLCTERMVELCAALCMFGNHYAFAHFLHVSGTSKKGRGGGNISFSDFRAITVHIKQS